MSGAGNSLVTPRAALEALIERLERGEELRRAQIHAVAGLLSPAHDTAFLLETALNGSLDAAVELAERVLPGHSISIDSVIDSRGERRSGAMAWRSGAYGRTHHAVASAPAIALVLAVCRARLAELLNNPSQQPAASQQSEKTVGDTGFEPVFPLSETGRLLP